MLNLRCVTLPMDVSYCCGLLTAAGPGRPSHNFLRRRSRYGSRIAPIVWICRRLASYHVFLDPRVNPWPSDAAAHFWPVCRRTRCTRTVFETPGTRRPRSSLARRAPGVTNLQVRYDIPITPSARALSHSAEVALNDLGRVHTPVRCTTSFSQQLGGIATSQSYVHVGGRPIDTFLTMTTSPSAEASLLKMKCLSLMTSLSQAS